MKVCVDVDYGESAVTTACVGFTEWDDADASFVRVVRSDVAPAPYEPGAFYKRELPHLLEVLRAIEGLDVVVVDGYVWLGPERPGLGARLHAALGGHVAVVGVGKTRFASADPASVQRGESQRPLFVTAIGIDLDEAARAIGRMHGEYRMPTLLKKVDRLARGLELSPALASAAPTEAAACDQRARQ